MYFLYTSEEYELIKLASSFRNKLEFWINLVAYQVGSLTNGPRNWKHKVERIFSSFIWLYLTAAPKRITVFILKVQDCSYLVNEPLADI